MWGYNPLDDGVYVGAKVKDLDPFWKDEDFGRLLARVSLFRKGIPETNINKIINLRQFLIAILYV